MSEIPLPSSEQPFVPATTRNIERANRLLSLRDHPGFVELIRLSQEIVQTAIETCTNFGGWDAQQIVVMKVRQQAAVEHHQLLLAKINEAIIIGLEEARTLESNNQLPNKTVQEIIEQGDHVRRITLEKFDEMDTARESRAPGSF